MYDGWWVLLPQSAACMMAGRCCYLSLQHVQYDSWWVYSHHFNVGAARVERVFFYINYLAIISDDEGEPEKAETEKKTIGEEPMTVPPPEDSDSEDDDAERKSEV